MEGNSGFHFSFLGRVKNLAGGGLRDFSSSRFMPEFRAPGPDVARHASRYKQQRSKRSEEANH
jgi:hypothetical protein